VKPFTAVTVITEDADAPALTAAGDVAERAKSVMMNVAVVERESVPLVPVIVRM